MCLTYDDAMDEETEVFRAEVVLECKNRGLDPAELIAELGDHPVYKSRDVMIWFGY